ATLLDPRSKKLVHFSETEMQEATTLLIKKYEMYNLEIKASTDEEDEGDDENDKREDGKDDEDKLNDFDLDKSLMDSIFGEESYDDEENKVDEYLKHKPVRNVDLLSW